MDYIQLTLKNESKYQLAINSYDELLDMYNKGIQSFYYYYNGKYVYIATEQMLWNAFSESEFIFVDRLTDAQYTAIIQRELNGYQYILDNQQNYSTEQLNNARTMIGFLRDLM